MTETEQLDTQAAAELELEPSAEEVMEPEEKVEAETQEQTPDPKDEQIAKLQAEMKRKDDRLAAYKGDKKLIANMVKGIMDEYGLTYDEAVKHAGNINPNDLKARLESADVADNPFEVQAQAFNKLYVNAGVKATLDEVYGEDTQPFVAAFERAMKVDDELAQEFTSLDASKLPAFVVKKGKEVIEKQKSTMSLAEENARLKAELEALKTGKGEVEPRKTLPLSGVPTATGIGPSRSANFAERLFN